jgi:hypothetical protein
MTHAASRFETSVSQARHKRTSLLVGVVAGIVCIGAAIMDPQGFWPAYLVAVLFVLGIGIGSLAIALLHQLTGGRWGWATLRQLVACSQTIPMSIVLLLPLAVGADWLYPWLREEGYWQELPPAQQVYFEFTFWMARSVGYFTVWILLTIFVTRSYRAAALRDDPDRWHASARLSAWGLIVLWITATFAAFDWTMALEPAWLSTIYGAIVMMGFAVSGLAFQLMIRPVVQPVSDSEPNDQATPDLATLLLAFLLVWVYFSFSQFFIIWHGDLPVEGVWYHRRSAGVWGILGTLILIFHFILPFILLLSRDLKRRPHAVAKVAAGLVFMRLIDLAWFILPAIEESRALWGVLVPVSSLATGGLFMAGFFNFHERLPLLPSVPLIEKGHAAETEEVLS